MDILYFLILVLTVLMLAYKKVSLVMSMTIMIVLTVVWTELRHLFYVPSWFRFANGIVAVTLIGFAITPMRRLLISDRLFSLFQKALPTVSETEQEALDAGTVWWDAEIFSGRPRWRTLLKLPAPALSAKEKAFLEGPVEELCRMADDWEICDTWRRLPDRLWDFMREHRFFGMIIPEAYGGLEFSAQANSAVVMKLASRNLTTAITVMVPNSLGPGELLLHYGTKEQKDHYLPRLAAGEEIPCFALTSPSAGSDAASMNDVGIVCKGEFEGKQVLGLKLTWNKRYITLAPVATLLGLAFKALDPDGLLGEKKELGITCALIPTDTPGVEIGKRHMPVGAVFMNGPTRGNDVFIPLDWIIGGPERIGQGWRMLMQSLAAGRSISLPALGTSGGKMSALLSGAYARIRKQFSIPIGFFEGIEEPLARIGGRTYRMDAARMLTLVALDQGERPGVLSAILKYQLTEENRRCVNDAMDIHGGKGIITGPGNYLAHGYQALPISITVEGANILTRSLIIFGQGAIRAHPWLLKEMQAARDPRPGARKTFDKVMFAHVGHIISNMVRAWMLGVSRGHATRAPVRGPTAYYFRQITRMSAAFSFTSDLVLLALGGKFKFRETLSGRLADALSHLYMGTAVLKRFEDDGRPEDDLPFVRWAMDDSLYAIQDSLKGVLDNFPIPGAGRLIKWVIFPLGQPYTRPGDRIGKEIARILQTENESRDRLVAGVYLSDLDDACGRVHTAFHLALTATNAENAIRNALNEPVTYENYEKLVQKAVESGVITEDQATTVRLAQQAARAVIEVDEFTRAEIEGFDDPAFRPAAKSA
ncbi:MAG: acyl-CoA dehydrogenase [Xanthomonadales bacterium]|jgi:acyl-CoA dehydrogenase|nr:acyl-CoA dehydrogenase [Xanthomonadales bacterium]MDH3940423.1 acyl-CoA dehydrogenase [Xanthomonadales bacterium]MDH4000061.1 acyl-CoA dehydrogenase [Xanthomonadales bacterium]